MTPAAAAPARAPRRAPARKPSPRKAPARKAATGKTAARPAPARKAVPRRIAPRTAPPSRGPLLPQAVGRTAVAVRALPDSGLVFRLTRGRAWIAVLGTLLTGIVALNVGTLTLGASSGRVAEQIQGLEQANLALRATLSERLSTESIHEAATSLGMIVPTSVRYLRTDGKLLGDAGTGSPVGSDATTQVPVLTEATEPPPAPPATPVETTSAEPESYVEAPEPSSPIGTVPTSSEAAPAPSAPPPPPAAPSGTSAGGVSPG